MNKTYLLYIYEDGAMKQFPVGDLPSDDDLQMIDDGVLTIIMCEDNYFYELLPEGGAKLISQPSTLG